MQEKRRKSDGAKQLVHSFLGGEGLGIQQGTSVWVGSPKSDKVIFHSMWELHQPCCNLDMATQAHWQTWLRFIHAYMLTVLRCGKGRIQPESIDRLCFILSPGDNLQKVESVGAKRKKERKTWLQLLFPKSNRKEWLADSTLFKSMTMFYGTDYIMRNILHIQFECRNVPHDIVDPTKHCYGSE